jgi:hypothetical protein
VRGTANQDQAFWSKPSDAEAGWMDDLSSEEPDTAETQALDELAAGRHETDRVFHELREVAVTAPAIDTDGGGGGGEEPDDALPPAASADFDFDAVTDDLLPSWNLGLG